MNTSVFKSCNYKKDIEFCVRPAHRIDTSLWCDIFGDDKDDIREFISACVSSAYAVSFVSSMKTLSQFLAVECNISSVRGIYIYALCTSPAYRGRGYMRELLAVAKNHFSNFGYKFFMLLPADEKLAETYRRIGFSHPLAAYATPLPEREGDVFGESEEILKFEKEDFDGDITKLYELSSKVFSYELFRYFISAFSSVFKVFSFRDGEGECGFAIACGKRLLLASKKHSILVRNEGRISALVMPFRQLPSSFYSAIPEIMPR